MILNYSLHLALLPLLLVVLLTAFVSQPVWGIENGGLLNGIGFKKTWESRSEIASRAVADFCRLSSNQSGA